jgi:hypothetical protein
MNADKLIYVYIDQQLKKERAIVFPKLINKPGTRIVSDQYYTHD